MSDYTILERNAYTGRGMVLGVEPNGEYAIQHYWIGGRSDLSKNRVITLDQDTSGKPMIKTEVADPSKLEPGTDTSLIEYPAMREREGTHEHIVTNGLHTDIILNRLESGIPFRNVLIELSFEPDKPNFTPRIMGVLYQLPRGSVNVQLALVKKAQVGTSTTSREIHHFEYDAVRPGFGYCITTYSGNGNPLPAFQGEPILLSIDGSTFDQLWRGLNQDTLVAMVAKRIDLKTGETKFEIRNKLTKVTA